MKDSESHDRPANIILATDLSCRCDRALDRAVNLSEVWNARLIASTVLDDDMLGSKWIAGGKEDPVLDAKWRLSADIASTGVEPVVKVRTGDVVEQLLLLAGEESAKLVVTGVARDHWMRSVVLGTVVDGLMRHSAIPTLVVRNRVRAPYRRIVVAGDLSELSLYALKKSLAWFPEGEVTFFHAVDMHYADLADAGRDALIEEVRRTSWAEANTFLDDAGLSASERGRVRIVVGSGGPVDGLNDHLRHSESDLVVVGGKGRGVLFEILIGSKTRQIVENIASDVLVIPNP